MVDRHFGVSKKTVSYFSLQLSQNVWKLDTCDFHANTINLCKMCTELTDFYLYDCELSSLIVGLQRLKGWRKAVIQRHFTLSSPHLLH
jgi:hypothetical protein